MTAKLTTIPMLAFDEVQYAPQHESAQGHGEDIDVSGHTVFWPETQAVDQPGCVQHCIPLPDPVIQAPEQ